MQCCMPHSITFFAYPSWIIVFTFQTFDEWISELNWNKWNVFNEVKKERQNGWNDSAANPRNWLIEGIQASNWKSGLLASNVSCPSINLTYFTDSFHSTHYPSTVHTFHLPFQQWTVKFNWRNELMKSWNDWRAEWSQWMNDNCWNVICFPEMNSMT